jgi:hypothetical protein
MKLRASSLRILRSHVKCDRVCVLTYWIDLFSNQLPSDKKSEIIQQTMEKINQTFTKNSIFYATQGIKRNWEMQCNQRSKHYTTSIAELAQIF